MTIECTMNKRSNIEKVLSERIEKKKNVNPRFYETRYTNAGIQSIHRLAGNRVRFTSAGCTA